MDVTGQIVPHRDVVVRRHRLRIPRRQGTTDELGKADLEPARADSLPLRSLRTDQPQLAPGTSLLSERAAAAPRPSRRTGVPVRLRRPTGNSIRRHRRREAAVSQIPCSFPSTAPPGFAPLAIEGAGSFEVLIGRRVRDRVVAAACGHNASGRVDVSLEMSATRRGQRLRRVIGGHRCTTTATVGSAAHGGGLIERRGPLELQFDCQLGQPLSRLLLTGWRVRLGRRSLRLPTAIMPAIRCETEVVEPGTLRVAVRISDRSDNTILTYEGTLR